MATRDEIIEYIHELYADRLYSLDDAFDNMRMIEEAAMDNANALADDIAARSREGRAVDE